MKVAAVSGDLLIKLALGLAVIGAGVWAARAFASNLPARVRDTAAAAAWGLSPTNPDNVFATGANSAVSAATGRPETLGGWFYDLTNPDPVTTWRAPVPQVFADPTYDPLGNRTN